MIAWQTIDSAPHERQVLLWYPPEDASRLGKCRVGCLRERDWLVFSAGGLCALAAQPTHWASIDGPQDREQ